VIGTRRFQIDDDTWRDVAVAAVVAGAEILVTHLAAANQPERRAFDALAIGILLASAGLLIVRRHQPVFVLAVTVGTTLLYLLMDFVRGPIFIAPIVSVYTAITHGHRLAAWISVVFGYIAFPWLPYLLGIDPPPQPQTLFGLAGWLLVIGGAAELMRARGERIAAATRTEAEAAQRRATEERIQLARELHDILAHSITVINVQASVGLHLVDERPEQARTALNAIKDVSKDALDELRAVVAQLRSGHEDAPRDPTPTPSLKDLDVLVARASTGGLSIRTEIDGPLDQLPPSADLAAFRILQEALTNVIRHSGSTSATVKLKQSPDELMLEVDDDGTAAEANTQLGRGIQGMRERAAALGGVVEAGPRPDGGYRVVARLPLGGVT